MTNQELLILITLFIVKHFIVDFVCQTKWQYSNKHILGHPGGIFHAWLHAMITIMILDHFKLDPMIIFPIGTAEWIIHYIIDYAKMNIGIRYNLKPDNSEWFWYLLGIDQLLHYLTYMGIVWFIVVVLQVV